MKRHQNARDLMKLLQPGSRIFVHAGAATPQVLLTAFEEHVRESMPLSKPFELIHLHTLGPVNYANDEFSSAVKVVNLFVGANLRSRLNFKSVDYLPLNLSEMPALFRSGKRQLEVAFLHVSVPNERGMCSLGVSVDTARAAFDSAGLIIAQMNTNMPYTYGDAEIPVSRLDHVIEVDVPLPESTPKTYGELEMKIARFTASLIEDGSTLQMGIGTIPDAVLSQLKGHRDLGIHTEMWTDGALELLLSGVVNNTKKNNFTGKTVSAFILGSKKVYDFIHHNKSILQLESSTVNDPFVIAQNPKVIAINSAVEIDLTGQVCADSIGNHVISGVGGQMDFITGAAHSKGGKPMIAITSRTGKGVSRLVAQLKAGAGVVTTRAHVHYVITEYGIADLYGKTIGERVKQLIDIAHPDDRASLDRKWFESLA